MWNLTSLGRGYAVLGVVTQRAQAAYGEVGAAQAALTRNDWRGSSEHFTAASALLESARAEFRQALSSSEQVVSYVDITGTVRSGDQLLSAAESVAEAGSLLSSGMEVLLGAKLLPAADGEEPAGVTLVAA